MFYTAVSGLNSTATIGAISDSAVAWAAIATCIVAALTLAVAIATYAANVRASDLAAEPIARLVVSIEDGKLVLTAENLGTKVHSVHFLDSDVKVASREAFESAPELKGGLPAKIRPGQTIELPIPRGMKKHLPVDGDATLGMVVSHSLLQARKPVLRIVTASGKVA